MKKTTRIRHLKEQKERARARSQFRFAPTELSSPVTFHPWVEPDPEQADRVRREREKDARFMLPFHRRPLSAMLDPRPQAIPGSLLASSLAAMLSPDLRARIDACVPFLDEEPDEEPTAADQGAAPEGVPAEPDPEPA